MAGAIQQAANYGKRPDGTDKGSGWLGELKGPDGRPSTELSIQFDDILGGKPIPLIVPTQSPATIQHLLSGKRATREMQDVAIKHALERDAQGLSPFKD